ncbi:hypothetical protein [Schleiferilactobacillus harbinensis]|uniref:hypothetical protein n=1 Tax=Schleiferilactobacillus harbinensis TaxID=304207 RepID=UPI000ABF9E69|nr:hypothetical protein [Schleiferilactobacillus harbinensis]
MLNDNDAVGWLMMLAERAVQKPRIFSSIFMLKIDQNVAMTGFVATPLLIFNRSLKDA